MEKYPISETLKDYSHVIEQFENSKMTRLANAKIKELIIFLQDYLKENEQ